MKLSIVLSTHAAQFEAVAFKGDFERNVGKIAALGYDGVELAVRDPNLLDVEQVLQVVGRAGLEVPAIGTGQAYGEEGLSFTDPDPEVRAKAIARIKDQVGLGARMGALVIIGLIRGRVQPGVTREQAHGWLVAALRDCADEAAKRGVRLALEPLNRYETDLVKDVGQGLALLDEVGSPQLGLLLDTFHMNIEEPSIEDSILAAGERIYHFHVADSNRWHPGAGHLDFSRILQTLRDTGYNGYVSAETLPLPDPDTCAQRAIAHLRPIVEKM
jgi:sugar phosphate isomerase/epimerase